MSAARAHSPELSEDRLVALLRQHAEPLPAVDDPRFADAFERYADARVVLIGEASHGTSEFYQARAAITKRLIERHGFSIVAVEADWPDAARIDCYSRQRQPVAWVDDTFKRFPSWMWRNQEVEHFVRWLREHNAGLPAERRVEFRGLDVYSLGSSIREVLRYLDRTDPQAAAAARRRYGCLSPWQEDPAVYGRNVMLGQPSCEQAVVEQLQALLAQRLEYIGQDGERFFNAERNAHVVLAAEHYYRAMYRGSTESWNLRDRHMFDTLKALLEHRGRDAKAVVWAHNSHIGNAAATSMGWGGEFNIGELCRTAYGRAAVLIGMATDRGEVAAADNWDEPMQVKQVIPSRSDSWEQLFLRAGVPVSLTDWRNDQDELRQALARPRLERAIGVIYRPLTERQSHYFRAILAEQFDAVIWIEQTAAVTPIGPQQVDPDIVPDTYPFGE
ncbi:carboxylic ester hydrolase [Stutzerimonas decontaminans]|jgi:erythromycin esterase-like protein|uniref:Carboxylic ester hydrolase n=2 Tax=Stutzerimonas TaxID=2901164 RepID=A0ABX4W5N7_9GAMM|nr:erythromycin esterase family protein [Stutzerimonas decontaminans]AHY42373.1 carboxylic ester hydrolase [Stutzerimonas decontaminans]MCQ4246201.1 erythromycin esterase family protein [Stutzerimonas decontaminans]PNF86662.1 carboxylic ester hydrolase [Stutzerimonas decontaminans]